MDSHIYKIIRGICDYLEGLFFGFCLVTLLELFVFTFYKKRTLTLFINYSVHVAKNLAIFYFVLYTLSLRTYYTSKEFDFFNEKSPKTLCLGVLVYAYQTSCFFVHYSNFFSLKK